jgi:transposase
LGRPSKYSPEFKRDAIALAMSSGKSINQTARELGMRHETLRTGSSKPASTKAGAPRAS